MESKVVRRCWCGYANMRRSGWIGWGLVTDAHSRKIVGYHVAENLQTVGVRRAQEIALRSRRSGHPLVRHSDRGVQYCSTYYQRVRPAWYPLFDDRWLRPTLPECLTARINGILKGELLLKQPANLARARLMVKHSVQIYNTECPHLSEQCQTPDEVHRAFSP